MDTPGDNLGDDTSTDDHGHVPVLLDEVLATLAPRPGETVVDATTGRGGHALAMGRAVGPEGLVVGFDLDAGNLEHATARLREAGVPFRPIRDSFVRVPFHLPIDGRRANVVLADLGVSSNQIDIAERGFSFGQDGPLDMRLDPQAPQTAARLIATLSEQELATIIFEYGEEPLARKIARNVVRTRAEQPINRTGELARLVVDSYGPRARSSRLHPATRTFMALRIAVNDELGALQGLLDTIARTGGANGKGWLAPGARVGIISFHSLEDRLVKRAFADLERRGLAERITRKPIVAAESERTENPRARSAKLRVVRMNGGVA